MEEKIELHKGAILLIAPPEMAFYGIGPNNTSMGVLSLKTYLEYKGFVCDFINANYLPNVRTYKAKFEEKYGMYQKDVPFWEDLEHPRWVALFDVIKKAQPRIVGMTCLDMDVYPVKILARKIKELFPQTLVVVGGATPTVYPEIFSDCTDIDILVKGEGEITMHEIASCFYAGKDISSIEGTRYFKNGQLHNNAPRPHIGSTIGLDSLPQVKRDFFYFDPQTFVLKKRQQLDGLLTSRGCAYSCSFCCASGIWEQKLHYRSIENVIHEMLDLRKEHGKEFDGFYIHDDNFLSSVKRVQEFCEKVQNLQEKFIFRCFSRVRPLKNEDLIYSLVKAGCSELIIGIESGSDYVLETMNKKLKVEDSRYVAKLLNAYDMLWRGFFIMGTPYERVEDAQKTIYMIKEIEAPISRVYCFSPYLGSKFFKILPDVGISFEIEKILKGNQEVNCYIGNLIPHDVYDEMFTAADRASRAYTKQWEDTYYLSDDDMREALAAEKKVVAELGNRKGKNIAIGRGRQIRWLAAVLHVASCDKAWTFMDLDYPEGRDLLFGSFVAVENLPDSNDVQCSLCFKNCAQDAVCQRFPKLLCFEDDILRTQTHSMRRVCEILRTPV